MIPVCSGKFRVGVEFFAKVIFIVAEIKEAAHRELRGSVSGFDRVMEFREEKFEKGAFRSICVNLMYN